MGQWNLVAFIEHEIEIEKLIDFLKLKFGHVKLLRKNEDRLFNNIIIEFCDGRNFVKLKVSITKNIPKPKPFQKMTLRLLPFQANSEDILMGILENFGGGILELNNEATKIEGKFK